MVYTGDMKPVDIIQPVPQIGEPGAFGAVRKFDVHTGIDLYCEDGALVHAVEYGVIVKIEDFTGPDAGSPWWNPTKAILVEGASGVIVYGEIEPYESGGVWTEVYGEVRSDEGWKVGDEVHPGDILGTVARVLKKDKGVTPTSMLHFELMKHGTRETFWWRHGDAQPEALLDPTELVRALYES